MKIGIIAHVKHPIKVPYAGGLEAFTHDVTRRLQMRGHEIVLFASSLSDPKLPVQSILGDENYDVKTGIRKKQNDISSEYIAEHHAYQRLMLDIDRYGFDVIFNNSLHYVPVTMANVIATPMLTVLHTPPFYELTHAIKKERQSGNVQYVTVSKANLANWQAVFTDCAVIENGIDLSQWKAGGADRGNYAVWFGRIHPDKGTHYAIQAAKLAGIPLKIAGSISDERYFKKMVEPLLNHDITFIGHRNHRQLNDLIANARLCIISPSWQEPFGLVVAEALACGTPVAGFAMGALPELLTEETGRLVPHGDIPALAEAINEVLLLDAAKIRPYAESRFDVEKMMDAYELLLQKTALKSLSYSA